jgi:altronate hydrolase
MKTALLISDRDNVAIALEPIASGQSLDIAGARIIARDAIPSGHKIARVDIPADQPVIKYGSPIGLATAPIAAGDHVHTHNLASTRGRGDLTRSGSPAPGPAPLGDDD